MATTGIFALDPTTSCDATRGLDLQVQVYMKDNFWPGSTTSLSECVPYFRYFQWTVNSVLWPNPAAGKTLFAIQTYQHLAVVVRYLDEHRDKTRTEIAAHFHGVFPQTSQDCILRSLDLAVRLWMNLHLDSRDDPMGPLLSDVTVVEWKPKQSLRNLVRTTFPRCRKGHAVLPFHASHIDPDFNITKLRKLCRVRVHWTHNLRDHLTYDHATRRLSIYPHKVCLLNHLERCNVYPREFLLETLRTLELLFPYGDKSTETWLEECGQPFHRTSSSHMQARARSLGEFQYWRRQLTELYHVFEQPPATIPQMWHDRRNPMQWYTFWLAALIAVLSIVFGSLGTYIGFKQIQLAEQSIRISLNQAA